MELYPPRAVERAMKVQEVILRAMSGQIKWFQVAEIIGVSPRTMRRWRRRYEEYGYDGLYDRRRKRPSPKRVPVATVEKVLRLYQEKYRDFNVAHFRGEAALGATLRAFIASPACPGTGPPVRPVCRRTSAAFKPALGSRSTGSWSNGRSARDWNGDARFEPIPRP